jgi:hypothetical protein
MIAEMRQESEEQIVGLRPARVPVEEPSAKRLFRRADLSAEGRLADAVCRAAAESEP